MKKLLLVLGFLLACAQAHAQKIDVYQPFGALATITPGTGVATALGINVGSNGGIVLNSGGTFNSGNLVVGAGTGSIQDSANLSGGVALMPSALNAQKAASSAPSSICSTNSYSVAFTCDLSKMNFAVGANITGATTLGNPTTGYVPNPNLSLFYGYYSNASGVNFSTTGNGGRTNGSALFLKADALGQGDTSILYGNVFVNSTCPAGATSFLACAAGQIVTGGVSAGHAGDYLQGIGDIDLTDNGFDVAGIGSVMNLSRTNATGALGATWIGSFIHSTGSASIDVGYSFYGNANVGVDLTGGAFGTNKAAITLAADQRIYGNSVAGAFFPAPGTTYFTYASAASAWQWFTAGAIALTVSSAYVGVINATSVNTGDHFGVVGSASTAFGMSLDNSNAGTGASTNLHFGNSTAPNEAQIILNGGSGTQANGANALTISNAGALFLQGGSNTQGTNVGISITAGAVTLPGLASAGTQCVQASSAGLLSGTGGVCPPIAYSAGVYTFPGADGSTQLTVGTQSGSVDFINIIGGISGVGGSIVATSATDANVPISITAKGNSNVNFGNSGSGQLAVALDPGATVSSGDPRVQMTPSTASGTTKVGNSVYGVNLDCGTNKACQAAGVAIGFHDVQTFITAGSFTWTPKANITWVQVVSCGGGGGGGGGALVASGTAASGGGGGGGGGCTNQVFRASDLAASETVTIGAGGAAVAGQTTSSTNGINGNPGGITCFGGSSVANSVQCAGSGGGGAGGQIGTTSGGGGGGVITGGGASATGASGASGGGGFGGSGGTGITANSVAGFSEGAGGGGSSAAGVAGGGGGTFDGCGGGGAGGGVSTAPASNNGGSGGNGFRGYRGVGSVGGTSGTPTGGSTSLAIPIIPGLGGGGGYGNASGASGTGGAGTNCGAGGGGGSALNGSTAGGGAAGSPGWMVVTSW